MTSASDALAAIGETSVLGLRRRVMALPSGDISYIDEGDGRTIVLLHGGPFTSLAFFRMVRALRGRYRVIAPDLPGFGYSTMGSALTGTLEDYARSVQELCEGLDLREFVLYVNDSSGIFGLMAASR